MRRSFAAGSFNYIDADKYAGARSSSSESHFVKDVVLIVRFQGSASM